MEPNLIITSNVGHEINEGNEVWSYYIKFVQLVERLCAPSFSPRISAFFATANKMPRLVGFYIKSLSIYLSNLSKNIDEK